MCMFDCLERYEQLLGPKKEYSERYDNGNCCEVKSNNLRNSCEICCHKSEAAFCINRGQFKTKCICVTKYHDKTLL
jgi:hypothetical protein